MEVNTKVTDLKASGKFGFMKRKQLDVISEEEDQLVVSVFVNELVVFRPCELKNYILLKEDVEEIQKLVKECGLVEMWSQAP